MTFTYRMCGRPLTPGDRVNWAVYRGKVQIGIVLSSDGSVPMRQRYWRAVDLAGQEVCAKAPSRHTAALALDRATDKDGLPKRIRKITRRTHDRRKR